MSSLILTNKTKMSVFHSNPFLPWINFWNNMLHIYTSIWILFLTSSCRQGPDFGYVTREAHRKDVSSLDSFGNLEVSPPVVVDGKNYPLGRILIGVAFPTWVCNTSTCRSVLSSSPDLTHAHSWVTVVGQDMEEDLIAFQFFGFFLKGQLGDGTWPK